MSIAAFASALAGDVRAPSRLSLLAKGLVRALAESRARDALRELHRHEAFLKDLGRRQDHSGLFLTQDSDLPVKI
ncbi:MAG: hypothetical protein M3O00_02980 [Pseudomonadota bacterium]|nr:hypothetical protein [Pseudomonadota bacterium]